MQIDEFEEEVRRLLTYKDDDGVEWLEESLEMYPAIDASLSASFRGTSVQCEIVSWSDALGEIVEHIKKAVTDVPAGQWVPPSPIIR